MAYEKQTWQCGDTISAEKLNHMEDGIAEGGWSTLFVNVIIDEENNRKLDKTWQEIRDAFPNVVMNIEDYPVHMTRVEEVIEYSETSYTIETNGNAYETSSPDGYPQRF